MDGDGEDDDEGLDELAAQLRRGAGSDARADLEAAERDAALLARRRRELADLLRAHMARGEEVTVTLPGLTVTGRVIHVAGDLAAIAGGGGPVELRLGGAVTVTTSGGRSGPAAAASEGPGSFLARLRELELAGARVEVGVPALALRPRGRIAVVAADHLVLATADGEIAIALDAVRWVAER